MNIGFSGLPLYFWIILIFTVLIVLFIVWTKIFFSNDNQTKIVTNKIKKYFWFLFDYGFKIDAVDVNGPNGAWMVALKSEKWKIRIIQDRSDVYCEVVPIWESEKKYSNLSSIITSIEGNNKKSYYPQAGKNINFQLEFYGKLLYSHYNQIVTFIDNYPKPFYATFE